MNTFIAVEEIMSCIGPFRDQDEAEWYINQMLACDGIEMGNLECSIVTFPDFMLDAVKNVLNPITYWRNQQEVALDMADCLAQERAERRAGCGG